MTRNNHRSFGRGIPTDDGISVKSVSVLAQTNEVGTFAHELGHEFGLPDLYNREQSKLGLTRRPMRSYFAQRDRVQKQ